MTTLLTIIAWLVGGIATVLVLAMIVVGYTLSRLYLMDSDDYPPRDFRMELPSDEPPTTLL